MGGTTSRSVVQAPKQSQISAVTHTNFNPDDFVGIVWYEIARLQNDFEKGCHSVAHIVNRTTIGFLLSSGCYGKNDIPVSEKQGQLFVPNPNDPSKMQLKYNEWFGGNPIDFWIYDLNLAKGYILIGNQQGMGWLLSSKPTLAWCVVKEVLDGMAARGFDLSPDNVWFKWRPISCGGSETTTAVKTTTTTAFPPRPAPGVRTTTVL